MKSYVGDVPIAGKMRVPMYGTINTREEKEWNRELRVWKEARQARDALRLGSEDVPTKPEKKKKVKNNDVRSHSTTSQIDSMWTVHH